MSSPYDHIKLQILVNTKHKWGKKRAKIPFKFFETELVWIKTTDSANKTVRKKMYFCFPFTLGFLKNEIKLRGKRDKNLVKVHIIDYNITALRLHPDYILYYTHW